MTASRHFDQARGEVHSSHSRSGVGEDRARVAGAGAEVQHAATGAKVSGLHEERERLAGEYAEYHQDRALAINPNDDRIVCQAGDLATYLGRPEDGERRVRHAMRLNPYHRPAYWLSLAQALYHQSRFEDALGALQRVPSPTARDLMYTTAALARLGRVEQARAVAARLHNLKGALSLTDLTGSLPYRRPEDLEDLSAALRLAGLQV